MNSDDIALFSYLIAVGLLLFRGPEIGPLKVADIFILIAMISYLFRYNFQVRLPQSVFLLFGGFLVTLVVSTALSPIVILSSTILELLRYILCMSLFLMTFDYISTKKVSFDRIRRVYIIATTVSSFLAVIGFGFFLLGVRHNVLLDMIHWTASPRMMPLYYDPNHYASVLLIGYIFLFSELFKKMKDYQIYWILFLIGVIFLVIGAIVTTGSRTVLGAMIGVTVFVIGLKVYQVQGPRVLLNSSIILFFTIILLAVKSNVGSLLTLGVRSGTIADALQLRISLWRAASVTWYHHPLLGVGPNNFIHYIPRLPESAAPETANFPHNTYIGLLAETGIIGGVFGFSIVLRHITIGTREFIKSPDDDVIIALGALLALLVIAVFLDIFDSRRLWFIFGIVSSQAIHFGNGQQNNQSSN